MAMMGGQAICDFAVDMTVDCACPQVPVLRALCKPAITAH